MIYQPLLFSSIHLWWMKKRCMRLVYYVVSVMSGIQPSSRKQFAYAQQTAVFPNLVINHAMLINKTRLYDTYVIAATLYTGELISS